MTALARHLLSLFDRNLDLLTTAVAAGGGVVVLLLSALLGFGQYGLGAALILGSLAFLTIRGTRVDRPITTSEYPPVLVQASLVIYLCSLVVATSLLLTMTDSRPAAHFVAVSIAFSTVALDVLYHAQASPRLKRVLTPLVLLKVIAVSLVYRTGRFYVTPQVPGYDINSHLRLASEIAALGGLPPESSHLYGRYVFASIFHSTVAAFRELGLSEVQSLFVIVCFFAVVTVLLAYAITRRLASEQAALFAALFVSVADMFVLRGVANVTPSILVLVFTMVVLLCFVRMDDLGTVAFGFVVWLLTVALFTHQLSSVMLSFVLVCLVGGAYVGNRLHLVRDSDRPLPVSLLTIALVSLLVITSWFVTEDGSGTDLFTVAVQRTARLFTRLFGSSSAAGGDDGGTTYAATFEGYGVLSNVLYNAGYSILFAVGVVGALVWVHHRNRTAARFGCLLAAAGLFALLYPGTAVGLSLFILPHRVMAFLVLFMAIFAAVAAARLVSFSRWHHVGLVALVALVVFFSVTTPFVAQDNPLYAEERVSQTELSADEIDAMLHATNYPHRSDTVVYVDPLLDPRGINQLEREAGQTVHETVTVYPPDDAWSGSSLAVVREYYREEGYQNANPGTFGSASQQYEYGPEPLGECEADLVYHNGEASVYAISEPC